MGSDSSSSSGTAAYPTIFKGREGRMNGQIIRFLALNGPSLIYSVAQDLSAKSETKVHYPTVNRRMHELQHRQFLEKCGNRVTKAGIPADLYAVRVRGDFAALAGIPDSDGEYSCELSPKEVRQLIAVASLRIGSPFILLRLLLEDSQTGNDLVLKEFIPDTVRSVRDGYLNIDAPDESAICSSFASLLARRMTCPLNTPTELQSSHSSEAYEDSIKVMMRSLDKMISTFRAKPTNGEIEGTISIMPERTKRSAVPWNWANELKVFLKLHSVGSN